MARVRGRRRRGRRAEHLIDRLFENVETGHFERSLSGVTAAAAVITSAEIYLEHYRASFGNKLMWSPILVTPPVALAGVMGIFSRRWAKTWLPLASAVYTGNGLLGLFLHLRGVGRRPGGFSEPTVTYNLAMGPPVIAPGLMTIVGALGLLAAVLRREGR